MDPVEIMRALGFFVFGCLGLLALKLAWEIAFNPRFRDWDERAEDARAMLRAYKESK